MVSWPAGQEVGRQAGERARALCRRQRLEPYPWWPVLTRRLVAGFQVSTEALSHGQPWSKAKPSGSESHAGLMTDRKEEHQRRTETGRRPAPRGRRPWPASTRKSRDGLPLSVLQAAAVVLQLTSIARPRISDFAVRHRTSRHRLRAAAQPEYEPLGFVSVSPCLPTISPADTRVIHWRVLCRVSCPGRYVDEQQPHEPRRGFRVESGSARGAWSRSWSGSHTYTGPEHPAAGGQIATRIGLDHR